MAGQDELGPSSEPSKDLVTSADERLRDGRKRLERAGKSQREPKTRNIFFFVAINILQKRYEPKNEKNV